MGIVSFSILLIETCTTPVIRSLLITNTRTVIGFFEKMRRMVPSSSSFALHVVDTTLHVWKFNLEMDALRARGHGKLVDTT